MSWIEVAWKCGTYYASTVENAGWNCFWREASISRVALLYDVVSEVLTETRPDRFKRSIELQCITLPDALLPHSRCAKRRRV